MTLSNDDITHIADLAKLAVDEADLPAYVRDLSAIFGFFETMRGVDTSAASPMAHPLDMIQPLRADLVTESDQRALFQAIAPQTEAGLYLVPRVIE